jgi:glycogen synthase
MDEPWHEVLEAGKWLVELERVLAPDLVHLNGFVHGALAWNCPVMVVAHSCVLSWWRAVKQTPLPAEWKNYERHVRRGLCGADLVIAPSRAMADAIEQHYGLNSRVQVIYNGADAARFTPVEKQESIFAAGRLWDEAKNIGALAKAAHRLSWPVVVAGDRRGPSGAENEFQNVQSVGQLSRGQTIAYMARSSIYALPAKYEPFGLSILEAALSGCALVLGDIPSLREIWGPAAVYVDPDDEEGIVAAIEGIIADRSRRIELANAARLRAHEFTTSRMTAEYLSAYSRLLQSHRERTAEVSACAL